MPGPQDRAWDAVCLIGWLAEEEDKQDVCEPVIRSAEKGNVRIIVSTLAVAEVIKLRHHPPIPRDAQEKIAGFFKQPYIFMRNLDPATAFLAQQLTWDHGIDPKDAVHVATALRHGAEYLDTFDGGLIKQSPLTVPDYRAITIAEPHIENFQAEMPLGGDGG